MDCYYFIFFFLHYCFTLACFQRIFSGKRIIDAYVRRSMECDTLHECHRMCEYERGFTCEGFNYR